MTPLERAARALCAIDANSETATMADKPLWQDYLPAVRAVLQALREPSDRMLAAAMMGCPVREGGIIPSDVRDTYTAMIDAALEEG